MDAANVNIEVIESDLGVDSMQRIQDAFRVLMSTLQRAPISNEVTDALCSLPNPVTPPNTAWFFMQVEYRDGLYTEWHGRMGGYFDDGTFCKLKVNLPDTPYLYFLWRATRHTAAT